MDDTDDEVVVGISVRVAVGFTEGTDDRVVVGIVVGFTDSVVDGIDVGILVGFTEGVVDGVAADCSLLQLPPPQ